MIKAGVTTSVLVCHVYEVNCGAQFYRVIEKDGRDLKPL